MAQRNDPATALPLGESTPGTIGRPSIGHLGLAELQGPFPPIVIDDGLAGGRALVVLGFATVPVDLPLFGATLFPQVSNIIPLQLDATGRGVLNLNPPGFSFDPSLSGLLIVTQGLLPDPGAMGQVAFTEGLEFRVGEAPDQSAFGGQRFDALGLPAGGVLADLDGDGHVDYVIADNQGDRVVVHLGDGRGRFAPGFSGPAVHFHRTFWGLISMETTFWTLLFPTAFSRA